MTRMFNSVLIANRGEIALRVQRACRTMGLRTIQIFSEADRGASYLDHADQAICVGAGAAQQSYLNQRAILLAAEVTGAQAIHPGYGFLSETADFAERVEAAGINFIGPTAASMRIMGDKIAAKRAMMAAGVPCVPGTAGPLPEEDADMHAEANKVGYPLILKAAAGGGGRGMRVVERQADLRDAVVLTRKESHSAFGDGRIYAERFLRAPRHIEIQVAADTHGHAVWLGARDCSLQRRHQKVIEEAPPQDIDAATLARIGERCVAACIRIGYRGVGTFEFLYEAGEFYFIEMNTRLQVEHPVTEVTTGLDIVQMQLRLAQGEVLPIGQSDVRCDGHAIECRINAEDPATFAPSPGVISNWWAPGGPGVRIDSHAYPGYRVPRHYDSLIGKLIVHGATRAEAIARLRVALGEFVVEGIRTNLPLHGRIAADPGFTRGGFDIHALEKFLHGEDLA